MKILTTCDLVSTVFRRGMIPESPCTFSSCDVIDIMNEELNIHIVPMILKLHEEYYVDTELTCLTACIRTYKISDRTIGNRLRDVSYVNSNGIHIPMTKVNLEDKPQYQNYGGGTIGSNGYVPYYLQKDEIVFFQCQNNTTGKIMQSIFLQPNTLVKTSRQGKVTCVTTAATTAKLTPSACISTACNLITEASHGFTTGDKGRFTTSCTLPSIACCVISACTDYYVVKNTCCTYKLASTRVNAAAGTTLCITGAGTGNQTFTPTCVTTITLCTFPTHFTCCCVYDIINNEAPNSIMLYCITKVRTCATAKTIKFDVSDLVRVNPNSRPSTTQSVTIKVNDYVMKKKETPVPQLPAELHPLLAQRTVVKILEATGDFEAMDRAQKELDRMEVSAYSLIDNRVEGSPQKAVSRHGLLRPSRNRW